MTAAAPMRGFAVYARFAFGGFTVRKDTRGCGVAGKEATCGTTDGGRSAYDVAQDVAERRVRFDE